MSTASTTGGALQRPLPGFAPKARGLFDQPGFSAVARQNLRLVLSDVSEAAFQGFGDASVQRTSRLAQKGAVGCILDQRVLKEITRKRRCALTETASQPERSDPKLAPTPARACALQRPAERD